MASSALHLGRSRVGISALAGALALLAWASPGRVVEAAPANPAASAKAQQVLAYLQGLPQRVDLRVLSGQNVGHGAKAAAGYTQFVSGLQTQTKKWAALLGVDYGLSVDAAGISAANAVIKSHWSAGGLVTVSIHFPNPFTGGDAWDRGGVNLAALQTPGSAAYQTWMGYLDKVATGLAELRDAGVVVLWRPLHELNGDWFWWSSKNGSWASQAEVIALWKQIFDYFTKTKALSNLLWVYAPNVQTNTSACKATTYYYPGSAYVDIVGLDAYLDDFGLIDSNSSYSSLAALGKPLGITEWGPKSIMDGSFDDTIIIKGIKSKAPLATFWLQWHSWSGSAVAIVDNKNASTLMSDPWVISRDQIALGAPPAAKDAGGPPPIAKDSGAPPKKDAGVKTPDLLIKKDTGVKADAGGRDLLAAPDQLAAAPDAGGPGPDLYAPPRDAGAITGDAGSGPQTEDSGCSGGPGAPTSMGLGSLLLVAAVLVGRGRRR